jgi:DNA alkylation damage repair protein AlkB
VKSENTVRVAKRDFFLSCPALDAMLEAVESERILRANEKHLRRCTTIDQAKALVPSLIVFPSTSTSLLEVSAPEDSTRVYRLSSLRDSVFYLPDFIPADTCPTLAGEILENLVDSPPHSNSFGSTSSTEKLLDDESRLSKLRWSCVGYHYNWGDRTYSPDQRSNFPVSFERIYNDALSAINKATNSSLSGTPESAIINFYHSQRISDRLGGHRDDVEVTDSTPLVSVSLGLSGVFLIESEAILLRSGDVVVMANAARQSLHGVPCVMSGKRKRIQGEQRFLDKTRISISIRQVY